MIVVALAGLEEDLVRRSMGGATGWVGVPVVAAMAVAASHGQARNM